MIITHKQVRYLAGSLICHIFVQAGLTCYICVQLDSTWQAGFACHICAQKFDLADSKVWPVIFAGRQVRYLAGKFDACADRLDTWQEFLTGRFDLRYSHAGRVHSWQAGLTWLAELELAGKTFLPSI